MNADDQRFNLVDLVKDQLSGGVLAKLPEILGTNQTSANTAVSASVPALLAALGSTASTPLVPVNSRQSWTVSTNVLSATSLRP